MSKKLLWYVCLGLLCCAATVLVVNATQAPRPDQADPRIANLERMYLAQVSGSGTIQSAQEKPDVSTLKTFKGSEVLTGTISPDGVRPIEDRSYISRLIAEKERLAALEEFEAEAARVTETVQEEAVLEEPSEVHFSTLNQRHPDDLGKVYEGQWNIEEIEKSELPTEESDLNQALEDEKDRIEAEQQAEYDAKMLAAEQVIDVLPEALEAEITELENLYARTGDKEILGEIEKLTNPNPPVRTLDDPPANDDCSGAIALAIPSSTAGDIAEATHDDPPEPCGTNIGFGLWYTVVGTGDTLTASTCNAGYTFDTEIAVLYGDCGNLYCLDSDDDGCDDPSLASIVTWCSEVGVTYYINAGYYYQSTTLPTTGTTFQLDIIQGGACEAAMGRCCYGDPVSPSCEDTVSLVDCGVTYDGQWTLDLNCDDNPCPIPAEGENCTYPISITTLPYTDTDRTTCGLVNDVDASCQYYDSGEDIFYEWVVASDGWYEIIFDPEASTYTCIQLATTCFPSTDVCIDYSYTSSAVVHGIECQFLAAGTYYIMIDSYASYTTCIPSFDLTVQECQEPEGRCCYGDPQTPSCTDTTEARCAELVGTWDPDSTCADPCPVRQVGDICGAPIMIDASTDLPYSDLGQTNCGRGYDYSETCLGSYDGGEDIIYQLDVPAGGLNLLITLNPYTTTWSGIVIDDECPAASTGCIAYSTNSGSGAHSINCAFYDEGTYYIMVDTYPSPYCIPSFDLTITDCGTGRCCYGDVAFPDCVDGITEEECTTTYSGTWDGGLNCIDNPCPSILGNDCVTPYPIADAGAWTGLTTCGALDDYETTCMGSYDGGEDFIFEWTVTYESEWKITLDGDNSWFGVGLHDACPLDPTTCLATAISSADPDIIDCMTLAAGTYYIMVDIYPSPECGDFDLMIVDCNNITGRCCYGDPVTPTCIDSITSDSCDYYSGSFTEALNCVDNPCPSVLGNDCVTPYPITDTGTWSETTCGHLDDYSETCLGSYDGDEDFIYEWTVTTGGWYRIILDAEAGHTYSGIALDDNCPLDGEDGCLAISASSAEDEMIDCIYLAAGVYYLMLDVYPAPYCYAFDLTIEECPCEEVVCDYTVMEVEPNDGCANDSTVQSIACSDTISGQTEATTELRDVDVYELYLAEPGSLVVEIYAEYFDPILFYGSVTAPAPGGCPMTYLGDVDDYGWCEAETLYTECFEPGYYHVGVSLPFNDTGGPQDYCLIVNCYTCYLPVWRCCYGYDVDPLNPMCLDTTEYRCDDLGGVWYDGELCFGNPCPVPEEGDNCYRPKVVDQLPYISNDSTCQRVNDYDETCLGIYDGGEDIIYELVVEEDYCYDIMLNPGPTTYTGILVDDNCPPDDECVAISTSSTATVHGFSALYLTAGTYYIMIDTNPAPNCIPAFTLTIDTLICPVGRCCYGTDLWNPLCLDTTEWRCDELEGDWDGTLDCTTPCPICPDYAVTAPGIWTGTTCGGEDDCALRAGEDIIYEVTIPDSGDWTITLCGSYSDWDTYMFIGTSCCGQEVGYDDDFCGLQSGIACIPLDVGVYYVDIEPYYDDECNNYQLNVMRCVPCEVTCPPSGVTEEEPIGDSTFVDTTNGGCNSDPMVFETVNCTDTLCGTCCAVGGTRDMDWFLYEVTAPAESLVWCGYADFPVLMGIIDTTYCDYGYFMTYATGDSCWETCVSAVLPRGTYAFIISPSVYEDVPCGSQWIAWLDCYPAIIEEGENCDHAYQITGALPQTFIGSTVGRLDDYDAICPYYSPYGPDVAYHYTPDHTMNVDISLCQDASDYDAKLYVYDASNIGPGLELYCSDDACSGASQPEEVLPYIECARFENGVTYCIVVDGFDDESFGTYEMLLEEKPMPANDFCEDRISVPVGGLSMGTTICATIDAVPLCDVSATSPGVWYSVVGNGNMLTASLCNTLPKWDTKLTVYCGNCDTLICVAGDDNGCGDDTLSQVEWCSDDGQEYMVLVHGYGGLTGDFQLDIIDGIPCDTPAICHCTYPVEDLTIQRDTLGAAITLRWTAPVPGGYGIWATNNKNNDGDPNNGADPDWWFVGAAQALNYGDLLSFDEDMPDSSYKNYVVITYCFDSGEMGRCCYGDFENPDCLGETIESICDVYGGIFYPGLSCPCPIPEYCAISYTNCNYDPPTSPDDWITNVTFNTINNTTSCEGCPDSYGDYTALSTDVQIGQTYQISVSFYSEGQWTEYVRVYIDWNRDFDFEDTGEMYDLGSGVDATLTYNITIPTGAYVGTTRMRVVEKYSSAPPDDGCDSSTYGETEDYHLNVTN